jgi:glycosyltransferase involved in cell wall biosynthesis
MARLLARVPLIFTEHGRLLADVPSVSRRLFNRMFFSSVAHAVAVSESTRESLVRVEGLPGAKIEVIYNGLDSARFAAASGFAIEARRALGIPAGAAVVGTVGRLEPGKNHKLLVKAISALRYDIPNLHLVIVGDGPEMSNLSRLAACLGVQTRCFFLGERHDIEQILPAFTVFALPSLHEGTPLTVLEAMAASVPIVATSVGGLPEILTDRHDALLVDFTDADEHCHELLRDFTAALKQLLSDPSLRAKFAAAASRRVRARHSLEAIFARYCSIYAEVLERTS